MLRYLRIAVTALCLTACVLLIALWVRSYWYYEGINCVFPKTTYLHVSSDVGQLFLGVGSISFVVPSYFRGEPGLYDDEPKRIRMPSLLADANRSGFQVGIPYWLLTLGTAALAALPWLSRRFSLRTLLIATTLVAVVLGAMIATY